MEKTLTTQLITLCDLAIIDNKGKLSLIGIFDQLHVNEFPGGITRGFFVASIVGKPKTAYEVQLEVEHNKEILTSMPLIDTVTSGNGKNNILLELINFGVPEAGEYKFRLLHKSEIIGNFTFSVFQLKQPGVKLGPAN